MKKEEKGGAKRAVLMTCIPCHHISSHNFILEKNIVTEQFCSSQNEENEEQNEQKEQPKYVCKTCDYVASTKFNWDRHIKTEKHLLQKKGKTRKKEEQNEQNEQNDEIVVEKHICEVCDYTTECKYNWARHIKTEKHYKKQKEHDDKKQPASKHSESDLLKITTMFLESMKHNQDFQKEIISIIKEGHSTSNSHNTNMITTNNKQKFNLNFFLNETCKDAMNLSEFVDTLQITLADLENVGKLGYEEGISRIFTNGLKALDITKRPIHCSDVKREVVYVKNENIWVKETDQLRKAIKLITNKNIKLIPKWKEANPGHHLYHNKRNDDYLKIMYESMGPTDESEEKKSFGKIITNLAKQTTISKL